MNAQRLLVFLLFYDVETSYGGRRDKMKKIRVNRFYRVWLLMTVFNVGVNTLPKGRTSSVHGEI